MAGVVVEMSGDEAKLFRSVQRLIAQQTKMEGKWRDVGRAGAKAGDKASQAMRKVERQTKTALDPTRIRSYVGALVGGTGLLVALRRINAAYETWIKNQRELSAAATTQTDAMISFLALQPAGTGAQRRQTVAAAAISSGVTDMGAAFDTVQAIQSVRGSFAAGLEAGRAVFKASLVGIPVGRGRELEVAGAGLRAPPGQTIRQAFVAGQLSGRDPSALAGAAPALKFFQSPLEALAIGSVLAGDIRVQQVNEVLRQAGIALGKVSKFGERGKGTRRIPIGGGRFRTETFETPSLFERLGVAGAPRVDKLLALQAAGLTTQEALKGAGLVDIIQQEALISIVPKAGRIRGIMAQIAAQATPGVFERARAKAEAAAPEARAAPLQRSFEAIAMEQKAFGPGAIPAQAAVLRERARGMALRAVGFEQAFGIDLIREDDTAGPFRTFLAAVRFGHEGAFRQAEAKRAGVELPPERFATFLNTMDRINNVLDLFERKLMGAAQAAEVVNRIVTGGEAMMPPGEDR